MAARQTSRGLLITCDVPTKQFILHVAKEHVLDVLDETHLFVHPEGLKFIQDEIRRFNDENAYVDPEEKARTGT
eukprot:CAMPEP_0172585478 /NCGR_PEP_ID=MMETSP1068-20121228/4903_1 /TAXON_ID=35684 /ORGANISM="Pseudopedinella elastica, Strain CCMP716" /LENGTH=73 /DNA_ID=CAMNT_0013379959 /DNA_START=176 /DNA_END=397 /DNA_ORIENTATION=+